MSALGAPPSPRLRLVPQTPAPRSAQEPHEAGRPARGGHLRLVVTQAQALDRGRGSDGARGPVTAQAPAELRRRPPAPRARGLDALVAGRSLGELAPNHPAVRARRRRPVAEAGAPTRRAAGSRPDPDVGPAPRTMVAGAGDPRPPARQAGASAVGGAPVLAVLRGLLIAGAAILVAAALVAASIVVSGVGSVPAQTTTATVGPGQSLWDVAAATGAGDVDRVMAQIVELNDLTSSTLHVGQVLLVPAG